MSDLTRDPRSPFGGPVRSSRRPRGRHLRERRDQRPNLQWELSRLRCRLARLVCGPPTSGAV
ncbi:hypothetical protein [Nocardioides sp. J54]|uniref:hypothetical protein n=1 Tax=Nocardioides sp. J54 TaxID=935866 RepID=UPI00048F27C6|nr:hypothetical protein [Nocardioides sp. J54]